MYSPFRSPSPLSGGVADQAMTDFDVNNAYGLRALAAGPSCNAAASTMPALS